MTHYIRDEPYIPVAAVYRRASRVAVYRERIGNALDENILLECVIERIVHVNDKVPKPPGDRIAHSRIVGSVGVTLNLDIPQETVEYLRTVYVCRIIHGEHFYTGCVQSGVVRYLSYERWHTIDR